MRQRTVSTNRAVWVSPSRRLPTASVFNWRTPLHLSVVAFVGPQAAAALLKLLALAAVLATAAVLSRVGGPAQVVGTLAQMGALATAFQPAAEGVAEIWVGVLLAHALCAYHQRWWTAGACFGAAAIFMRELAGPFGASCGVMALSRRRAREAMVWVAAGVLYAAYFAYHVVQVQAHRLPGDLVHEQSWIQPNGIRFLLATAGVNGWLQFLPQAITAVFVPVALAGAASARMPEQARAALLLYAALFTVIGLPFNYYWGFVTAPLWAFGLAYAPDGLARLWRAAGEPQPKEPVP